MKNPETTARVQEIRDEHQNRKRVVGLAEADAELYAALARAEGQLDASQARAAALAQELREARDEAYQLDRAFRRALGEPL
jgi:hypothetical protein